MQGVLYLYAYIKNNSTFSFSLYVHSLKGSGVGKDTADSVNAEERKRIVLLMGLSRKPIEPTD